MKMKLIISGIMLTLLCLLGGCDDKLEVQQAYEDVYKRQRYECL